MDVTVLEAGDPFKPFTRRIGWANVVRRMGLIGSERTISRFFPHLQTTRVEDDMVLVWGLTTGGTTAISSGNLVRTDNGLREVGVDLTPEYEELEAEIGIATVPRDRWRPTSAAMHDAAVDLGLDPVPTTKLVDMVRCVGCGLCELGCATGAKWDSRRFLDDLVEEGGTLRTGARVRRVLVEDGRARGVEVEAGRSVKRIDADVVVLAAGGTGNPPILRTSGLEAQDRLWVDVVLTVGGVMEDSRMLEEPPMVWHSRSEHYMLSPYIDILAHFFHPPWRSVGVNDRVGMMIKLADAAEGEVRADGTVRKSLTDLDRTRLDKARGVAIEVMEDAGVGGPFVDGMLNAGHLGGTVPLSRDDADAMRPSGLPEGLWVADLSLAPRSQGLPTILTAAALGLRVARRALESTGGEGRG
jgi:choline dehydrogenase-like flavoprotein